LPAISKAANYVRTASARLSEQETHEASDRLVDEVVAGAARTYGERVSAASRRRRRHVCLKV